MSGGVAARRQIAQWSQQQVDNMHAFNARLMGHEQLRARTVLPVGDGVALATRR
jgi:predicted O-methyltransferase YrrM